MHMKPQDKQKGLPSVWYSHPVDDSTFFEGPQQATIQSARLDSAEEG